MAGNYQKLELLGPSAATATGASQTWHGWRGSLIVEGDFTGGGSAKLQYKSPRGTWVDVDAVNLLLTGAGVRGFECPPGEIRVAITGTVAGVYAYVITNNDY